MGGADAARRGYRRAIHLVGVPTENQHRREYRSGVRFVWRDDRRGLPDSCEHQAIYSLRFPRACRMDVESDFTAFGRIVYWGVVLGLAFLLIVQPSRGGTHSERAAIGG